MNEQTPQHDKLAQEVALLATSLEKQNSLARRFALGIATGVGTALGATVVAGVVVYILGTILSQVPWADLLGDAIQQTIQRDASAPVNNR
jgi:hypothetical protein